MKKIQIKNDLCVKGKVVAKNGDNDNKKKGKKLLLDK